MVNSCSCHKNILAMKKFVRIKTSLFIETRDF